MLRVALYSGFSAWRRRGGAERRRAAKTRARRRRERATHFDTPRNAARTPDPPVADSRVLAARRRGGTGRRQNARSAPPLRQNARLGADR